MEQGARETCDMISRAAGNGESFYFALDYAKEKGIFIDGGNACVQEERNPVLFQIGTHCNFVCRNRNLASVPRFRKYPPSFAAYRTGFDRAWAGLRRGDSFLINLTARTRIETDLSLDEIFFHARAPYKILIPDRFVCFSPEIFVRMGGGVVSTFPMKGTIAADVPDAEKHLLGDYKETCEHATVVDLLRNDLNSVASGVYVKRYRYLEKIPVWGRGEIWQSSSEICGNLQPDWKSRLGEILWSLLPAGSVTGAPKISTLRLIRESESDPRGWYTGICGYFDGENLDSAVMIRCVEKEPQTGRLFFHSGGGVTVHSRPGDEYEELVRKVYLPVGTGNPGPSGIPVFAE